MVAGGARPASPKSQGLVPDPRRRRGESPGPGGGQRAACAAVEEPAASRPGRPLLRLRAPRRRPSARRGAERLPPAAHPAPPRSGQPSAAPPAPLRSPWPPPRSREPLGGQGLLPAGERGRRLRVAVTSNKHLWMGALLPGRSVQCSEVE